MESILAPWDVGSILVKRYVGCTLGVLWVGSGVADPSEFLSVNLMPVGEWLSTSSGLDPLDG